jgi:methyl-accepting chemotaxis protein
MAGLFARFFSPLTGRSDNAAILHALDRSQAIIRFDPRGHIREANANFRKAVGYTRAELVGSHHRMLMPAGAADRRDYAAFWRALARGEFRQGSFKRIAKDGSVLWLQASYNPIRNRRGEVVEVVKFAADVTAETLTAAERAGQVDAVNRTQAVIHFDTTGTILWANETFLTTVGYTLDQVTGAHHRTLVPNDIAESDAYRTFWRDLAAGETKHGEFRRVARDGSTIWLNAAYNPVFDPDGAILKVIKYAADVTDAVTERQRRKEVGAKVEADLGRIVEAIDNVNGGVRGITDNARTTQETVKSVASAAEEFQSSAQSISHNADDSRERTASARATTEEANAKIRELADASSSMSEAVELIRDISEQINLLALNATIEAARAGEAGKGFAVVAQEVKKLANQSASATEKISQQIGRVQTTTNDVVGSLESIVASVETVESSISSVAGAIEQQTASSGEMARNIAGVSEAVEDIKSRLDTIATAAAEADRLAREGTDAYRQLQA